MRNRLLAVVVAAGFLSGACGGNADPVYESRPLIDETKTAALPAPKPAAPVFVVSSKPSGDRVDSSLIAGARGVAVAAPVSTDIRTIDSDGRPARVKLAAVDALQYRSVAPGPTRDADFVWRSLLAGEAVVTFRAARKLGIKQGGSIRVPGYGALRVGAFADNGSPNVGDVLVDLSVGQAAGFDGPEVVVVGARSGSTVEAIGRELRSKLPDALFKRLTAKTQVPTAPPAPQPVAVATGSAIGTMTYRILPNGFIRPDPAWVSANIADGTVPILGTVTCNRILFPQLSAALGEIESEGLGDIIRHRDYGGCYVPRFIDRNPAKPLSMHAFGLAVDLNTSTNWIGTRGDMDPRIVAIFEKWGFEWGGHWSRPDPMHFQLDRIVSP